MEIKEFFPCSQVGSRFLPEVSSSLTNAFLNITNIWYKRTLGDVPVFSTLLGLLAIPTFDLKLVLKCYILFPLMLRGKDFQESRSEI